MCWILLSLAAVLLVALSWQRWEFRRNLSQLERLVSEVFDERAPATFVFQNAPRFMRIALRLEQLDSRQRSLREQIVSEKFNLRAILASMVEGVAVIDGSHTIQLANASLMTLFDLREEPAGKTVLHALRESSVNRLVEAARATGEPQSAEISLIRSAAPNTMLHLAASATAIDGAQGAPRGVVLVFHDITRLRQLEEVRREFVANVSHELRTPLSIIAGYLETLADNPAMPRSEVAGVLAVMQRHSQRLAALLDDLLTLARLESRREELHVERIDLRAFAEQLLRDWKLRLSEKNIAGALQFPADLPQLNADRFRLEQVFSNLLDNALRYTPAGGKITLSAKADDADIHIRVEDTGAGIPPDALPRIFERFYRAEKARSRERGGTGLGLSIVKHIVALHGGSVHAESALGKGTAIVLRFSRTAGASGRKLTDECEV